MMRAALLLAIALSLAACASTKPGVSVTSVDQVTQPGWRGTMSAEDAARLEALPSTWATVRGQAERKSKTLWAAQADLLSDTALDHPALPPGSYNCRLVSLGQKTARGAAVRVFNPFFCYVRGEGADALSFTKQTGTDLPGGWLHPDGERRYVFLGAKQRKAGDNSLGYGTEEDRDLAGVIERIAPFRWRLVVPWRNGKPGLEVYELTPVPADLQAPEATQTTAADAIPGG
jgi:Domain of unknown function (DUF4893)